MGRIYHFLPHNEGLFQLQDDVFEKKDYIFPTTVRHKQYILNMWF